MSEVESPETFDADYVKSLRQEAGKYRQEVKHLKAELEGFRGLEAQVQTVRVENELVRRGVSADPTWINLKDGEDPSQAVDRFLEKWPQFGSVGQTVEDEREEPKSVPRAMPPQPTKLGPNPLSTRGLDEIKEDPVARNNLTDLYRELLKNNSNQTDS